MAAGDRSTVKTIHTLSVVQASMGAGPTLTNILGVEEVGVDPQVTGILNYGAGDYRPSFSAVNQIQPMFDWTCSATVTSGPLIAMGKGSSDTTMACLWCR